jgi:hypothetical protein
VRRAKQRRPALADIRKFFKGMGKLQHAEFAAMAPHDLEAESVMYRAL